MDVGKPSLDQLAIFLAVVDAGSFHGAARQLGRAVSAISYGMTGLEAQLGLSLFAREGSRRPVLTEPGKAVLAHARAVSDEVAALVAGVRALGQGLEAELALAVDVMCPIHTIAGVLRDFQMAFPTVELRLHVEGLGAIAELVLDGRAQLGIAGPTLAEHPQLNFSALGDVELVPVAAPFHPLARAGILAPGIARQFRQLVLTDRSPLTEGREFGVVAARTWRLGDLGAKHALLLEGIGWGNMPRHMVAADLAAGRLVLLALPEGRRTGYPLRAIWRRDCNPGPAREWMLAALTGALEGFVAGPSAGSRAG